MYYIFENNRLLFRNYPKNKLCNLNFSFLKNNVKLGIFGVIICDFYCSNGLLTLVRY